jgi:hypothetical protein
MSDASGTPARPEVEPGVMGSLPKTRPQRRSARRNVAPKRRAAETVSAAEAASAVAPQQAQQDLPRAPRQGFEASGDIETGKPLAPPNGLELATSVVELLGELAQSGIRSGEQALRDALKRLGG